MTHICLSSLRRIFIIMMIFITGTKCKIIYDLVWYRKWCFMYIEYWHWIAYIFSKQYSLMKKVVQNTRNNILVNFVSHLSHQQMIYSPLYHFHIVSFTIHIQAFFKQSCVRKKIISVTKTTLTTASMATLSTFWCIFENQWLGHFQYVIFMSSLRITWILVTKKWSIWPI